MDYKQLEKEIELIKLETNILEARRLELNLMVLQQTGGKK